MMHGLFQNNFACSNKSDACKKYARICSNERIQILQGKYCVFVIGWNSPGEEMAGKMSIC